jgi:cytochrome P450 family 4
VKISPSTGLLQVIADRKVEHAKRKEQERLDLLNGNDNKHRPAFLDLLLDVQEESQLTDEDIREEVDTFMFEGHDTVSSSMGFFSFMLGHNQDLQEKVYAELCEIFGDDMDRDVTTEDIGKMKYLDQCVRETMRLLPTVPLIGRVLGEDTNLGGYIVPKGVTALIAPFAVQRDRRCYANPDLFDPEHFSPENVRKRNPFAYIPFSAGQRNCIGQKFATNEQRVVLAKIFRRFKFVSTVHELENRGLPELILKPSHGFPMRVERRVK